MEDNQKNIRWKQRFENFEKAFNQLSIAVQQIAKLSDLEKEGLIQRFEYTFELAWKTMKDYLESQNVVANYPREVIKESFYYGLLENGDVWMEMLEKRNLLAHTYNEIFFNTAIEIIVNEYFPLVQTLYTKIKEFE
jgi:nucleotidyltransferase substrate binding protein (TIGR01987 family)